MRREVGARRTAPSWRAARADHEQACGPAQRLRPTARLRVGTCGQHESHIVRAVTLHAMDLKQHAHCVRVCGAGARNTATQ